MRTHSSRTDCSSSTTKMLPLCVGSMVCPPAQYLATGGAHHKEPLRERKGNGMLTDQIVSLWRGGSDAKNGVKPLAGGRAWLCESWLRTTKPSTFNCCSVFCNGKAT